MDANCLRRLQGGLLTIFTEDREDNISDKNTVLSMVSLYPPTFFLGNPQDTCIVPSRVLFQNILSMDTICHDEHSLFLQLLLCLNNHYI